MRDVTRPVPHGCCVLHLFSLLSWQTVRFYINETRKSMASFDDVVDEDIWLIYNDKVVFSGRHIKEDVSAHAKGQGRGGVTGGKQEARGAGEKHA